MVSQWEQRCLPMKSQLDESLAAGHLEPDPNRYVVTDQRRGETMEVFEGVRDRHSPTTILARYRDQDLVAVLGNVDGDQDGRTDRTGGHSRSPQVWFSKTTVET